MAAVGNRPAVVFDPSAPALLKFIGAMWSIASVKRVGYEVEHVPPGMHLWILFGHDDADGFAQAVTAERELRQDVENALLYVHFFTADEAPEELLPPHTTIFSR